MENNDKMQSIEFLKSIVSHFSEKKILVIGDMMLDEYIWGTSTRLSPEAPVPVVHFQRQEKIPGGAFNVVNNIHALGAKVFVIGKIGKDAVGQEILSFMEKKGITSSGLIQSETMPTIIKTRILAGNQQVVRLDKEKIAPLSANELQQALNYLQEILPEIDAIILSDYAKGMIEPQLLKKVIQMASRLQVPITVDPQVKHFYEYKGVFTLTPNHLEAAGAYGKSIDNEEQLIIAGKKLLKKLKAHSLLITRGKDGMTLFYADEKVEHIPTVARKVFDVTGAGDTVISVFTLAAVSGANLKQAAVLSNIAAGYVVGEVGTATINPPTLLRNIKPDYIF